MKIEIKYETLPFTTYDLMLHAGVWKEWLPELKYKYMVAAALNECIYDTLLEFPRFLITGYLLAGRRIYLTCKIRQVTMEYILELFYSKIKKTLEFERKRRHHYKPHSETEGEINISHLHEKYLFEIFPIKNFQLLKLIKGEDVDPGYYDPKLERLKTFIQKEQFCSVIDYVGGESPIQVTRETHDTPHKKEKIQQHSRIKNRKKS